MPTKQTLITWVGSGLLAGAIALIGQVTDSSNKSLSNEIIMNSIRADLDWIKRNVVTKEVFEQYEKRVEQRFQSFERNSK